MASDTEEGEADRLSTDDCSKFNEAERSPEIISWRRDPADTQIRRHVLMSYDLNDQTKPTIDN